MTSSGLRFLTRTIFIAAGVGAFQPKQLRIEGLDKFLGRQFFYSADSAGDVTGKHIVIHGGGDAALECAINLLGASNTTVDAHAGKPASVVLIHRRDVFQAEPALVATLKALCDVRAMQFTVGQITGYEESGGILTGVEVTVPDGTLRRVPLDMLLVFLGLSPKLGPIADWGLALERKQLTVDTETFSTSMPGIFAVGDINTYPGKKKLILCGFHECVLAADGAAPLVFPDKKIQLQYTTTSPRLHKLLLESVHLHNQ